MLDAVEKVTRIVFTVLLGAVVSVAGLQVQWDKLGVETDAFCLNQFDKVTQTLLVSSEDIAQDLVERYRLRCGGTPEEAGAAVAAAKAAFEIDAAAVLRPENDPVVFAMNSLRPETGGIAWNDGTPPALTLPDPPASGALPPGEGFVALGRPTTEVYAQVNFDRTDGRPATGDGTVPANGEVLRARWEVNLRANTDLTTSGRNPPVGLIHPGQCVALRAAPVELRGQLWAQVATVDCPPGG